MMDILGMDGPDNGFMDAKDLNDKQLVYQNKCVDAVEEHSEGPGNSYRSKNHCC